MSAWEDLDNDVLGLRQEVNAEAFAIAEAARVAGDTRSRKVIFAETARQLLMRRGVRFAGTVETIVAVNPEEETNLGAEPQVPRPGRSIEKRTAGEETPVAVAETTDGAVYPDDLCSPDDIPMKFRRLAVVVPPLVLSLRSADRERSEAIREHAVLMRGAIAKAYDDFMRSEEGTQWCWRKMRLPPSAFRSQRSWDAALSTIRATPVNRAHLWPAQNVEIALEWATSPADDRIIHAAVGLMHRTCSAVGDQDGDGGLYQVRLDIDVRPAAALIPRVFRGVTGLSILLWPVPARVESKGFSRPRAADRGVSGSRIGRIHPHSSPRHRRASGRGRILALLDEGRVAAAKATLPTRRRPLAEELAAARPCGPDHKRPMRHPAASLHDIVRLIRPDTGRIPISLLT